MPAALGVPESLGDEQSRFWRKILDSQHVLDSYLQPCSYGRGIPIGGTMRQAACGAIERFRCGQGALPSPTLWMARRHLEASVCLERPNMPAGDAGCQLSLDSS
jgi:hypothetical protein